jgi:hypothetical protein
MVFASFTALPVVAQNPPASAPLAAIASSFRCPEELPSDEARKEAVDSFTRQYAAAFPGKTVADLSQFRYQLLVSHHCTQTLANIRTSVSPATPTISPTTQTFAFEGHSYGPRAEDFDPATGVWTVRFRSDGISHTQATSTPPNEILLNFYGWHPATDPKDIAEAYIAPRPNIRILGKFQAPDDLTKRPAFFILSESIYPGEPDAFVNISEITSLGTGAYAVTFSHFVPGANAEQRGKDWYLSPEGHAVAAAIGHIAVDPAWEQHFASTPKPGSHP